jgi:hypothetical protein
MESQYDWKLAAERRQGGEIEIAAVIQPGAVQVMTVDDVGRRLENISEMPGAREIKVFPSHLTSTPSPRLSHDEAKDRLKMSDSP